MANTMLKMPKAIVCWSVACAVVSLVGCESSLARRPGSVLAPPSPLRQAAERILDSEVFPKPSDGEKTTMEREMTHLKNAPRYEAERVGAAGKPSRYRAACRILADYGRKAVPMLLESVDDDRPVANLYIALTLDQINPRIAKGIWQALDQDHRVVPCMKGREFYSASVSEAAKLRGELPEPQTEAK